MRRRLFSKDKDETNNKKSEKFADTISRRPRLHENSATAATTSANALLEEENRQEKMANQLLTLVSSLKHNFTTAGSVVREDNASLDVMQRLALSNRENLERERVRLRYHAYQSCFNCIMIMTVILVIWSFLAMIIIMRVFPKSAY